jgi:hypothetical protein
VVVRNESRSEAVRERTEKTFASRGERMKYFRETYAYMIW